MKYFQQPAYPDAMPVDISFVFEDEKPAGKHGFLQVSKKNPNEFCFEDGTPARFWGVNFNGGANFPPHDYSEKVASRLAQAGCNIVRFHQLDAEWDTPNIYGHSKGRRVSTTRKLDPVSLDRLDYLIYSLKQEGVYVYFDMMTYRKFKSGDGVPFADELKDSAKPYSFVDRRLIDLQKEFADQIWNHVNPYTKLAYKDDPVIVMTEITNECDIFTIKGWCEKGSPHYNEVLRKAMQKWMDENGYEFDCLTGDIFTNTSPVVECKLALTRAYFKEMRDHMKAIGVKIPITGTNWLHESPALTEAENEMDFSDSHLYYYDWRWGEEDKFCANDQINGHEKTIQRLALSRLNNRPFFVSEWDMPWPNCYRAEGPIFFAAISALQGWSGCTIHTYAYGTRLDKMDILGKESSSATIGGTPYREGIFSVWNDPAKFGLFYHSALIVRRADITPAKVRVGLTQPSLKDVHYEASIDLMEQHQFAIVPDGEAAVGCDEVVSADAKYPREDPNVFMSDNGQVWRNLANKVGGIDTPRTKVVYGRLSAGRNGATSACAGTEVNGLSVKGKSDFAVIALSSLTDDPIETSDNMLLSTIGRVHNAGQIFDGDRMVDYGHAPIEAEVISAEITIRTNRTDLKVWGVNAEGFYVGQLPTTFADGQMTFKVGEKLPACYYLIVAE